MRPFGIALSLLLISSAYAQSCLEELLFSNEIAETAVCFNTARLFCSPVTYPFGCDVSPDSIAVNLSMSLCHYLCCNPNLSPVCFWRSFAQRAFVSGLDCWRGCGLPRGCYDPVYLTICCVPVATTLTLSTPLFIGYYGGYGCALCLNQCGCDFECCHKSCDDCMSCCSEGFNSLNWWQSRPLNNGQISYSVVFHQGLPVPQINAGPIQPNPPILRDEPNVQPASTATVVHYRKQSVLIFEEILSEPILFLLGVLFLVFNYYLLDNFERILGQRSR